MGRYLKYAKWAFQAALGAAWLASVLGVPTGLGMTWLLDAEVWLTNMVPDPILTAFLTGLLFSFWLVPLIWRLVQKALYGPERTRKILAQMLQTGVELRNEGRYAIYGDHEWREWVKKLEDWRDSVYSTIEHVSEADAIRWRILNTVPDPDVAMETPFRDDKVEHEYAMHHKRIEKLEKLIDLYGAR